MKIAFSVSSAFAIASVLLAGAAAAESMHEARIFNPETIDWQQGPPSLPAGAEAAVLYGDPAKEGPFALRLKLPAGYHIPPHTHPKPELITVISGTFALGMGESADENATEPLSQGAFVAMDPDMAHFVFIEDETVVQLTTVGPWSLTYIDPADDPRKSQ